MTFTLTFVATVLVFNVLFPDALALWRLQCDGIVAQAMIDPIMSPGNVSGHVHTAKGANGTSFGHPVMKLSRSLRCAS